MKDEVQHINLKEKFRSYGYKYTEQRQQVMEVILQHWQLHLSSDDIYEFLREKGLNIAQSTVYRTLVMLERIQAIRKVDLSEGYTRYEICSHEDRVHHHLICSQCGSVIDLHSNLLEDLENEICSKHDFHVKNRCFKFYGKCKKCRGQLEDK